jgi:curved DNA-binding protein CbpA
MERDPYKVLAIPPLSSENEIEKAYRKKNRMYNPDVHPTAKLWAEKKIKEITEAYNILNNPEKRKKYDISPQFQLRRIRKTHGKATKKISADLLAEGKPTFKESSSLLDRIKSIFYKPPEPEKIVNYNPKEADMHFALGISLCDNIKFIEQAPNEFEKAIQFDPNHMEAHYNIGIVYYKLGQFEEASIHFQKVLALDKNDKGAFTMMSILRDE